MKNKAINHLNNTMLPFWKNLKDEKGFSGYVSYDLSKDEKHFKSVILNSRILWFFSMSYLNGDEYSLSYATHAYNFLKNYCLDKENGGVFWTVNSDGTPKDTSKDTYNQAFSIYGLSAYYEASKDNEAMELALEIFYTIEKNCKEEIGYGESYNIYFEKLVDAKLADNEKLVDKKLNITKTMNTALHILEAYTELYKVTKNEDVKNALIGMLDLIKTKIYKKVRLAVFFNDEYEEQGDVISYGHDIEAAWLIDRGISILEFLPIDYKNYFYNTNSNIVNQVLKEGYDGVFVDNEKIYGEQDSTKVWWVQAESVVGLINEFEKTKNIKYNIIANQIFNNILQLMVDDRANSEWHWELDENFTDSKKKPIVEPWKCPYHNGRMIFEIIRRSI